MAIRIAVVGSGYVGMSLAVLLAQHNDVVVLDIDPERVDMVNGRQSTVSDTDIETFLAQKELHLTATLDKKVAYKKANFVVIATPTNYDPQSNRFDTSSVDNVVNDALKLNSGALIVIKSTVPVGHTKALQEKYKTNRIIFSPEFLREGRALSDNLYPSRIILGSHLQAAEDFAELLKKGAKQSDIETLFIRSTEAEAVKLFANTYLAMRVSFFNELDTFAQSAELDARSVIEGVSLDSRIGHGYNNPSFGYGGYCLPKDTKQLLSNYRDIPQEMIEAVVASNDTRKDFIAAKILESKPNVVGFYRLAMKSGSDNFRSSAIQGIMSRVQKAGCETIIYEPLLEGEAFHSSRLVSDLDEFKGQADLIVCNRISPEVEDSIDKVFSRDIYREN